MTFDTRAPLSIQSARTINVGRGSGAPIPPGQLDPNQGVMPNLFYDWFASGDLEAPDGPAPALNAIGFEWEGRNATSVVTQDPENGNVVVTPGPNIINDGRDWTAKIGQNSLRARYNTGANQSEQRFNWTNGEDEIWLAFWLRVPTNLDFGGASGNQKLFRLWQDEYGANSEKIGMEFAKNQSSDDADFYIWANGTSNRVLMASIPSDRGRWMEIVCHTRVETSPGASDGFVRIWRKWEGEQNHTQTHAWESIPISKSLGFRRGYLMGWANSAYNQETEFLVDGLKVSTTPLVEV